MMGRLARLGGLVVLALAGWLPQPAAAETPVQTPVVLERQVQDLSRALRMAEAIGLLREEGIASGQQLAADLPGGAEDALWRQALQRIYDPTRMGADFDIAFAAALAEEPEAVLGATAFFASEFGQRALGLELAARQAMLDKDVETAATLAYDALAEDDPDRRALIDRFVAANDLIESNVMGAMNANLGFLRGLADAGGAAFALPEADMLAQVWNAEPETRAEMAGWLFPFLALAYQPLSDAELLSYIEFSETPAGRKVNAAMFQAFDVLFDRISRDLGRAFARSLQGDDI